MTNAAIGPFPMWLVTLIVGWALMLWLLPESPDQKRAKAIQSAMRELLNSRRSMTREEEEEWRKDPAARRGAKKP